MTELTSQSQQETVSPGAVLRLSDVGPAEVSAVLLRYGLVLQSVPPGADIPGSFWGDEEAGLIDNRLLVRPDTPLHSILHEACHYVCMDEARRAGIHTDAGGDYDEENAVCFLQVVLAEHIEQLGRQRMFEDMDRWGYTFRLGSAQAWFERDAEDALAWLLEKNLIDEQLQPCWSLRED
jgi:hypothetical protein